MKKYKNCSTLPLGFDSLRRFVFRGRAFFALFLGVSLLGFCGTVWAQNADGGPSLPGGFDFESEDFFNFGRFENESDDSLSASALEAALATQRDQQISREGSAFAPSLSNQPALPGPQLVGTTDQNALLNLPKEIQDKVKEETRRQAFDAAIEGMMPLRPEEIRTLLERHDRTQESIELPVYPAPRPEIAVETLSLDPGVKPKTISVSHGYVTTFTVVDSTGAPWPIEDITWAGDFEVIEAGGETRHLLRITPRSEFAYGNMSMRLIGLKTPIILSLETARDFVHYRFDAIVPKSGPYAEIPIIDTGVSIAAGDHNLVRVLEGGLPGGAKKLDVTGSDGRTTAYDMDGMTYLRTPLTLLSPAWKSSTSSSDGMRVYSFSRTPVVLLSENGRMVRIRISPRGDF